MKQKQDESTRFLPFYPQCDLPLGNLFTSPYCREYHTEDGAPLGLQSGSNSLVGSNQTARGTKEVLLVCDGESVVGLRM
jgi:hypothetical protein